MMNRCRAATALSATLFAAALLSGCTGGQESTAAETQTPKRAPITTDSNGNAVAAATPSTPASVDAQKELKAISTAIPIYAGAAFRDDLTRRDSVTVRGQYGPNAKVYTLATNDSYPQVYHYYTTYLAQFRAYDVPAPYPPEQQNWRTLEVPLNQAMQDPFIPGDTIKPDEQQVVLQVAETEAEPHTVIRYIVTPRGVQPPPVQQASVQQ
jgi:hypothetical protein